MKGFSLVEILLVIAGIGFLVILMAALPNSVNLITHSRYQSLAREIATKQIETVREQSYANLALGTQNITNLTDPRIKLLPGGNGVKEVEDCDPGICKQAELVKKVTVSVNWTQEGSSKQVKLVTFVSDGGLNQ